MVSIALVLLAPTAEACGGFFSDQDTPVRQAGQAIVFEVSPATNQTTMHVQVSYAGPPTGFAWVVPVQGTPELFVSHDRLFEVLDEWTRPRFGIDNRFGAECVGWEDPSENIIPVPSTPPTGEYVHELLRKQVGPYETVVLAADNTDDLVSWLQGHGYAVPTDLAPILAPYVASGNHFVALRLASGEDAGDLVPLGIRYDGLEPTIPIQPTRVAATPDMPLVTYVLGPSRAIPTNYLHVALSDAAIDWFGRGSNYLDVLSRAADEAGGHAFATEFSEPAAFFQGHFHRPAWADLDLAGATGPEGFINRVQSSGIPANGTLMDVYREFLPLPEGFDAEYYDTCPSCYPQITARMTGFDLAAAATAIRVRIVEPLEAIEGMFARTEHITRLGTTMSPAEMTLDPRFGFNADLPQGVDIYLQSPLVYVCEPGDAQNAWDTTAKELHLPSGLMVRIPSDEALEALGMSDSEFLQQLIDQPAARRIERLGTTGQAEVLVDHAADIERAVAALNTGEAVPETDARGCTTAGNTGLTLWGLALLAFPGCRRRS